MKQKVYGFLSYSKEMMRQVEVLEAALRTMVNLANPEFQLEFESKTSMYGDDSPESWPTHIHTLTLKGQEIPFDAIEKFIELYGWTYLFTKERGKSGVYATRTIRE